MKDEEYQRMVLKNINSKFSESEVINLLSKKLKQIECELGIVKSERDEAIFNFESEKKTRKKLEVYKRDYSEKVDENRELKMKIKELDKEIKYLTDKLY